MSLTPKQEAEKKEKLIRERKDRDINALMNQPEGRRFIRRLLSDEVTRYYLKTHGQDSHNSSYLAGKNSVGVDIVAIINAENKSNLGKLLATEQEDEVNVRK